MALAIPKLEPDQIDQAGKVLVHETDFDKWSQSVRVINAWRASHAGPLNTFRMNLRRRVGRRGFVVQRLKRLPSIISKLERLPRIRLSRMQDIGGCRAVLRTSDQAYDVALKFGSSRIRHKLIRYQDYIKSPRRSGYRGLHMMYAYDSDQSTQLDGLNIEVQIRSLRQHQWATAVETVGTFTRNDLKSSQGNATWLRFFALMSTEIAMREGTPGIPDTPTDRSKLVREIRECDQQIGISRQLAEYQDLTLMLSSLLTRNKWVVLELDLADQTVNGSVFNPGDLEAATDWYVEREVESRGDSQVEVVLVSAASVSALRRAYPNYFADLGRFQAPGPGDDCEPVAAISRSRFLRLAMARRSRAKTLFITLSNLSAGVSAFRVFFFFVAMIEAPSAEHSRRSRVTSVRDNYGRLL